MSQCSMVHCSKLEFAEDSATLQQTPDTNEQWGLPPRAIGQETAPLTWIQAKDP